MPIAIIWIGRKLSIHARSGRVGVHLVVAYSLRVARTLRITPLLGAQRRDLTGSGLCRLSTFPPSPYAKCARRSCAAAPRWTTVRLVCVRHTSGRWSITRRVLASAECNALVVSARRAPPRKVTRVVQPPAGADDHMVTRFFLRNSLHSNT